MFKSMQWAKYVGYTASEPHKHIVKETKLHKFDTKKEADEYIEKVNQNETE